MASQATLPTHTQNCSGRTRQQDGQDDLGNDGDWGAIQRAQGGCIAATSGRVWEGQSRCNAPSVETGNGKTHLRHSASSACFWSGPVLAEGIMASGHCVPHQQAAHMAAPTEGQNIKIPLPTESRPHMAQSGLGPKGHFRPKPPHLDA